MRNSAFIMSLACIILACVIIWACEFKPTMELGVLLLILGFMLNREN